MTARPTRIAQTSKEAQREYKKNGARIPEGQLRQLERAVVLDERAARHREQEQRKRIAKQKREEKDRKEKAARRQLGVGLATQLAGYSHTQANMKSGMEAFLGFRKRREEEERQKEAETTNQLDALVAALEEEPWDEDDGIDAALDQGENGGENREETPMDDDLDDATLLEAQNLVQSDIVKGQEERGSKPIPPHTPSHSSPSKPPLPNGDAEFIRLHGPINKYIESLLDPLPDPLTELLSLDVSTNIPQWTPSESLLHKLNPVGLPPHRLRLKTGCTVVLLRDLNLSSQVSKSSQLRVLRIQKDRLECLILDGQLEGTKTILTRYPFIAKYRNDDQFPFQRTQFPVRVSTDPAHLSAAKSAKPHADKSSTTSGPPTKSIGNFKKPAMPAPRIRPAPNPNPTFKLPSLPASKTLPPPGKSKGPATAPATFDGWDDFLDSASQIVRDLSSDEFASSPIKPAASKGEEPSALENSDITFEDLEALVLSQNTSMNKAQDLDMPFSTQDLELCIDDLEDLSSPPLPKQEVSTPVVGRLPDPALEKRLLPSKTTHNKPKKDPIPAPRPPHVVPPSLKRKEPQSPLPQSPAKRSPTMVAAKSAPTSRITPPAKTNKPQKVSASRQTFNPRVPPTVTKTSNIPKGIGPPKPKSLDAFSEFGLSTQEAISFFDDDDFSSPTIAV